MNIEWQDALMRLSAATVAGIAIGINRDLTNKPIGMRTLALVSLGAAAVTVASIQFSFIDNHPDALSRVVQGVIQGIMAGISFIGAGVILRDARARTVEGLTTAATVWVTAGVRSSIGAYDCSSRLVITSPATATATATPAAPAVIAARRLPLRASPRAMRSSRSSEGGVTPSAWRLRS